MKMICIDDTNLIIPKGSNLTKGSTIKDKDHVLSFVVEDDLGLAV